MTRKEELITIERILAGERELFTILVKEHSPKILSVVRGVVKCREDAEEIAQDVFVKAFFSLKKFRGECSLSTWLFRIAYNLSVSKTRLKKRDFVSIEKVPTVDESSHPDLCEEDMMRERRLELLEKLLKNINQEDRFLILLFYNYDKSIREISQITGIGESNVKVKLHRIKKSIFEMGEEKMEAIYG